IGIKYEALIMSSARLSGRRRVAVLQQALARKLDGLEARRERIPISAPAERPLKPRAIVAARILAEYNTGRGEHGAAKELSVVVEAQSFVPRARLFDHRARRQPDEVWHHPAAEP